MIEVSALNEQIKSLIESTFLQVSVIGEVSRVTYHTSGHLYFTLKDAKSSIKCVMFRGNNTKLKFRLEEGMEVVIQGGVSVYIPNGNYQILCQTISLSGQGDLQFAFEQLKKKLSAQGYFDIEHKKKLPTMPKNIALITSKTGAALQDMLKVATKRWPLCKITLFDTLVQGESAATMIASNISHADVCGFDAIVVARGGGSLEDLWCFNEEIVADAIYQASTPIISAIGHEIDFLISDFVADKRASTPSNAMEILLPDKNEWLLHLDSLIGLYQKNFLHKITLLSQSLVALENLYRQNSIKNKIALQSKQVEAMMESFSMTMRYLLEQKSHEIQTIEQKLPFVQSQNLSRKHEQIQSLLQAFETLKPTKQLKESFVQITKKQKKTSLKKIKKDDLFELSDGELLVSAQALQVEKI
jgi:exodeoxyribonuclease VII large subunit